MSQNPLTVPSPITHSSDYQNFLRTAADAVFTASSSLPDDLSFHRSLDRQFSKRLDLNSERVLTLASKLLDYIDAGNNANNARNESKRDKGKRRLDCEEDVVDNYHSIVVDVLDQIIERADMALDELTQKNKPPAIPINLKPQTRRKPKESIGRRLESALAHAAHIPKPQLLFLVPVDNRNTNVPWQPQLRSKPNALIPLEESIDPSSSSQHPYSYEIRNFKPPPHLVGPSSTPLRPEPLESSPPLIYISEAHQLPALLQALSQTTEIAVDLEHHSYRSFSGFVCLMQISTRTQDWVIDCLCPDVRQELECLNEVFTNPNIVKVLHGANSDIVWLQENFNLYIVNLFDTYHASVVLELSGQSLAALLGLYCDFTADKRYQLADWRIRPLPSEMVDYARCDTHFLLYIYDNLRNALLHYRPPASREPFEAGSPLLEVIRRSSATALRVYVKKVYDAEGGTGPGGWESLCKKWNKTVGGGDSVHAEVFKAIHAWRDRTARREDESTRYVLQNHNLFRLAEKPPSTVPGLLCGFHPIPPIVRAKSLELLDVIKKAVERSSLKPSVPKADDTVIVPDEDSTESRIIGTVSEDEIRTVVWDKLKPISNIAPLSTLFGSSTTMSALLGGMESLESPKNNEKYINAIRRIHSTLTLSAPLPPRSKIIEGKTTPIVTTTTTTTGTTTVTPSTPVASIIPTPPPSIEETTPNPAAVVEIPFIPPSQRPTIVQDPITNENVVVVGRQRKRKRKDKDKDKAGADDEGDAAEDQEGNAAQASDKAGKQRSKKSKVEVNDVQPYDFSKEKNILDESASSAARDAAFASAPASGKKKKDKSRNNTNNHQEKSTFGPPPRNRSEMKSGNMSGRFK